MARHFSARPLEAVAYVQRLADACCNRIAGWVGVDSDRSTVSSPPPEVRVRTPAATPLPPADPTARQPDRVFAPQSDSFHTRRPGPGPSRAWYEVVEQIGHDLRTPLNAVIGFSDVMSAELLGPVGHPRYREYAGDIRDSGRRLLKAAEDTIAVTTLLAQAQHDAPVRLCVPTLAISAWSAVANDAAARHADLIIEIEDETEAEVLAPELALRQALINLMSEALSRSMPGGRIVLKAIPEDDAIRLEVTAETAGVRSGPATLPISLARALLELQGAGLLEFHEPGRWTAVTILDRATQRDFFPDAFRASAPGIAAGVVRRKAPVYA